MIVNVSIPPCKCIYPPPVNVSIPPPSLSLFLCICILSCIYAFHVFLRALYINIYNMLFPNIMFSLSNALYMPYTNILMIMGTSSDLLLMVMYISAVFVVYTLYNTAVYMFNFQHLCYYEKYRIYANLYMFGCFCFVATIISFIICQHHHHQTPRVVAIL